MHRRFIYIVNPISGTGNKASIKETIEQETEKAGFSYNIYPSVASGDYTFLHALIKEKKITDVIISGGDGTINQVVHSLRNLPVQFGIIPSGSGNGLAFSAGIPKNISKALKIIFEGKVQPTDAFLVNGRFACMLCGLGLDAQVAHDFADVPQRGLLTYVKKTISNFISAPSYHFEIFIKRKKIRTDAFFMSIANSNQFGNHFTIAPKASLTDGLLDVVIMTKQNKLAVVLNTLKQVTGLNELKSFEKVNENSSLIYFQTDEIIISNAGDAPLHIDGDPVETLRKLEVKVLPAAFRLIYP